jgi:hypothetical protein
MFFYPSYFLNVYYDVRYSEKEKAKSNGLSFDFKKKKWYSKHELHNFHNGDKDPDLDGLRLEFNIIDYKITDNKNIYCPQYDDDLKTYCVMVESEIEKIKHENIETKKRMMNRIRCRFEKELIELEQLEKEFNEIFENK